MANKMQGVTKGRQATVNGGIPIIICPQPSDSLNIQLYNDMFTK